MLRALAIAWPLMWREPQPAGPWRPVRTGITPGWWGRMLGEMDGDVHGGGYVG